MSKQMIYHPAFNGLLYGAQALTTPYVNVTAFTISAAAGSDGIALPFFGDGSGIKSIDVRVSSNSQAGTLHCKIESPDATPDSNNVSGMPDGVTITNGTAGTAAVTGAIDEIVTLTFATAPTPTGLHYLIFEGSSGGTIDIVISSVGDYSHYQYPVLSIVSPLYYSSGHWNNKVTSGAAAVSMKDSSGDVLDFSRERYIPYHNTGANLTTSILADNKECMGVEFTAQDNMTELVGIVWSVSAAFPADMNFKVRIATAGGSVIATSSLLNQQMMGSTTNAFYVPFDTPVTLTPGTTYRIFMFNSADTADDISLHYWDLGAAADQSQAFGLESGELALCTATDPPEADWAGVGSWTTDGAKMPWIKLAFAQDVTALGGGGGGGFSF